MDCSGARIGSGRDTRDYDGQHGSRIALNPVEGYPFPGFWTADLEAKRQAVNHWIRTSKAYDAVIDFDKALRGPSHPSRLLPAYDGGNHVHPDDVGYRAMADAIDLFFRHDED